MLSPVVGTESRGVASRMCTEFAVVQSPGKVPYLVLDMWTMQGVIPWYSPSSSITAPSGSLTIDIAMVGGGSN